MAYANNENTQNVTNIVELAEQIKQSSQWKLRKATANGYRAEENIIKIKQMLLDFDC